MNKCRLRYIRLIQQYTDVIGVVPSYIYQIADILHMTDLPSNFDFHKFLNDGIKDEFSPILEGIKQTGIRAKRREDITAVLDNYFKSKEIKSVSAS